MFLRVYLVSLFDLNGVYNTWVLIQGNRILHDQNIRISDCVYC